MTDLIALPVRATGARVYDADDAQIAEACWYRYETNETHMGCVARAQAICDALNERERLRDLVDEWHEADEETAHEGDNREGDCGACWHANRFLDFVEAALPAREEGDRG